MRRNDVKLTHVTTSTTKHGVSATRLLLGGGLFGVRKRAKTRSYTYEIVPRAEPKPVECDTDSGAYRFGQAVAAARLRRRAKPGKPAPPSQSGAW